MPGFGGTVEWDSDADRRDLTDLCFESFAGDDHAYLELASV